MPFDYINEWNKLKKKDLKSTLDQDYDRKNIDGTFYEQPVIQEYAGVIILVQAPDFIL